MYGSSGKLGRGGGGRAGAGRNRNIHSSFHPSPLNRPSSAAGRSSMASAGAGAGARAALRNRAVSPLVPSVSTPSASAAIEETYSLITSNPLNFAMTIRLVPNLVEEIKRVEAQGGVARIKFDGNTNNPLGNIISVGGKEFRFTWSPETGDLCDIYEERQSGEDGTGLLVESGSAWRKLNVQRVLDESTKNHVKLRSEEAERKNKSRKAIVLDHRNPSTKSHFKALAASESNPCRNFKTKKEQPPPAKKRKVEPVSAGVFVGEGPPKSVHKSGSVGTATTKGRTPTSPLVSPPEHLGAPTSPIGCVNIAKGHANKERSTQGVSKTTNYDKDFGRPLVDSYLQEKPGSRSTTINQQSDLRTVLISLLKESSLKGMSLKALEKAAEEAIPNSGRQIKSILKEIATFQAPGKYFLNSGVETESLKKPLFEKQSSPEDALHPSAENEKEYGQQDLSELTLPMRIDSGELDENIQLRSISQEEPGFLEKVDALNSDTFGTKKITGNSEGPSVNSSDSDSENDSSDSESLSRSRSISLSGSGSESSSDSESDASANDHEKSDEEVDIMTTDDDGEKCQLQASGSVLPKSPVVSGGMDGQHGRVEIDVMEDAHNMIDIEKKDFHERLVLSSQTANALKDINVPQRDIPRPHKNASQSNGSYGPRVDRVDIVTQSNMGIEMGDKDRHGHADRNVDTATEVHGKRQGIIPANVPGEHVSQGGNIRRKPKPNSLADVNDKHKDASLTGSNDSNQRRRESSSDETSCPYSKYEKAEPQLKGSIRDVSEYAEYMKEYKEKYDIYVSLVKVLESSREEFLKHQREIEAAVKKDPERYSKLVRQIKESFGQSAERHKRLKRIFVVLYEESVNLKQKIKEFAAPYLKNE